MPDEYDLARRQADQARTDFALSFKCQDPWSHDRIVMFTGIVNAEALV
jgi:hypothetical protein